MKLGEKSGYYINCENCEKRVYKTRTEYNKSVHHFCSTKCQQEYNHKLLWENRACEFCGDIMHVRKKHKQRFCSTKCQVEWQKTRTGILNPKFTSRLIDCEYCGSAYYERQYAIKDTTRHHFCSVACRENWYRNVFSQSPEWKEASRVRAVNILSNRLISKTNSRPQQIINNLLNSMGINYINEYSIMYYAIDNYLQNYNLMIEVMGDFWHCNPTIYEYPKSKIQKLRIPKDKAKHTYVHNKNIEILYLWEWDIIKTTLKCEKLIELYIKYNGILKNYHSFNYTLDASNQLTLNDNLITAHQDRIDKLQLIS